jgi:RNA polymerase sigma factor (sigma-70 family)
VSRRGSFDPLLAPLLETTDAAVHDAVISQVIAEFAEPLIQSIIRYKLGHPSDAEDLRQEAVTQLLAQFDKFRRQPETHPIADVRGLAAVIAHRTCSRWMRRQFPERHALKNRLHYILTLQKDFDVWRDESNNLIAGFASWRRQKRNAVREGVQQTVDDRLIAHARSLNSARGRAELAAALTAIFNHFGGPIALDKLVSVVASLLGVEDRPIQSTTQDEDIMRMAASREPDPAWQAEKRIFLTRLWEEMRELPLHHRCALLLHLKDAAGVSCIALFPATGVADFKQLAEALEMSVDALAETWNDLPLEDAKIAELLQMTRQQVINARKSARERLARRLKGFL